ncbi:cytotoxin (plasmid) [Bacillus mycoides]|uniref:SAR2788 family putative toxin n=1 Tax=Bacillus mycoides TaxID=1405 RepID=UPI001C01FDB4|nr:SAR2788 family putative toxin [Bacillus mycoides]QWH63971.1 cytotoxin [Bacillus mycoides]
MQKWLLKIMILTLFITLIPNLGIIVHEANAATQETDLIDQNVEQQVDSSVSEGLNVEVITDNSAEIIVESAVHAEDFTASTDVSLDKETGDIQVNGNFIDENGEEIKVNFDVEVIESNEEVFIANFKDQKTGKIYEYDTTKLQASIIPAVPVVLALVARVGIQAAIKKWGKTALRQVSKQLTKSNSPVWKGLSPHKGKTKASGKGSKKKYYEWDHTHNDIEVYDSKGKHLGSMDPLTGDMIKGPVKGRSIKI